MDFKTKLSVHAGLKVSIFYPSASSGFGQLCKPASPFLHHTDHAIFSRHLIFVGLLLVELGKAGKVEKLVESVLAPLPVSQPFGIAICFWCLC